MDRAAWIGLGIGVLLILAIAGYYTFNQREADVAEPPPPIEAPPSEEAPPAPPAPVEPPPAPASAAEAPEQPAEPALPTLEHSDGEVTPALRAQLPAALGSQLIGSRLIERIVVVIDNLDGPSSAPLRQWPIRHIPSVPVIEADGDRYRWHPSNADRYRPYVDALRRADAAQLVALYRHYQPLFQSAYAGLGYPDRQFEDRLVEIIDHLLAAPSMAAPIPLVQPRVLYRYADPRLEARSWGEKQMLRIGPEHTATVKAALRRIRAELTGS